MRARLTAALTAAVLSFAHAALGLADLNSDEPESVSDYLAVLLFSASLTAAAVAFALLRRLGAGRLRRTWRLGLALAVAGGAAASVGNLGADAFGVSAFDLLFALGGLALLIGVLTAGASVLLAGPPWRWAGLALSLIAIAIAVGEQAGFTLVGLGWIALALVLGRSATPLRPT